MRRHMDDKKTKDEVWDFIQRMNRTWTSGKPEELKDYFHRNMVAIAPTDRKRFEGQEACMAAWRTFAEATKIKSWRETDQKVDLYNEGRTAIVTYYYHITFQMDRQTITTHGRDMFTLVKDGGRWWAVADQFSPNP
jgi:hypothetical protein